jgi:hypothetical protein
VEDFLPADDPSAAALQGWEPHAPLWPLQPAADPAAAPSPGRQPRDPWRPLPPREQGVLAYELPGDAAPDEDLSELADRISRILIEEARRHGVDV